MDVADALDKIDRCSKVLHFILAQSGNSIIGTV